MANPAIDIPPSNSHGWFNRACALTRWAIMNPHTHLRYLCKLQAQIALDRSRQ